MNTPLLVFTCQLVLGLDSVFNMDKVEKKYVKPEEFVKSN